MKLRKKIILGFTCISLILASILLFSIFYANKINKELNNSTLQIIELQGNIQNARAIIQEIQIDIVDTILFSNKTRNKSIENLNEKARLFYLIIDILSEKDNKNIILLDEVKSVFRSYYVFGNRILQLPDVQTFQAKEDSFNLFKENKNKIISIFDQILLKYTQDLEISIENMQEEAKLANVISLSLTITGVIIAVILSFIIASSIVSPIEYLTKIIPKVSEENLTIRTNVKSRDETKILGTAFNHMLDRLEFQVNEKEILLEKTRNAEKKLQQHYDEIQNQYKKMEIMNEELYKKSDELQTSEGRYRLLAENATDVIWTMDLNYNLTYISPSVERMRGFTAEEISEQNIEKRFTSSSVEIIISSLEKDLVYGKKGKRGRSHPNFLELEQINKDGSLIWTEVITSILYDQDIPIGFLGISRDISRRKQVEEENEKIQSQLVQSQKMDAIGTLAGGLAHDFNNVLGGIVGTLSIFKYKYKKYGKIEKDNVERYFNIIEESAERAKNMVNQLLTLSRKQELVLEPIDLNKSILNVLKICKNSIDKSVEMEFDQNVEPTIINADLTQIEQVLLNFCVNASHAMTIMKEKNDKWGGVLTISVEKLYADDYFCNTHPGSQKGNYWQVSIKDNGIGMDNKTISKIFTPFFTTKDKKGTGLGLSMVYNIIKQHKGLIDVYSEIGIGTTFNVYLPVFDGKKSNKKNLVKDDVKNFQGNGLILVADDEEIMRQLAIDILEECGYKVITANNGKECIELFKKNHRKIDVVVLDMVMPEISGKDAYIQMNEIDPHVKVLLASGFKQDERVSNVISLGVNGFIQKPYTLEKLINAIQKIS